MLLAEIGQRRFGEGLLGFSGLKMAAKRHYAYEVVVTLSDGDEGGEEVVLGLDECTVVSGRSQNQIGSTRFGSTRIAEDKSDTHSMFLIKGSLAEPVSE